MRSRRTTEALLLVLADAVRGLQVDSCTGLLGGSTRGRVTGDGGIFAGRIGDR
ncbi:MAG: hypothetical protein R3298_10855 [Gammaproteobacteria bacterium]|nr:hypothetical protein [Gammaproteobacteria bacterium]